MLERGRERQRRGASLSDRETESLVKEKDLLPASQQDRQTDRQRQTDRLREQGIERKESMKVGVSSTSCPRNTSACVLE